MRAPRIGLTALSALGLLSLAPLAPLAGCGGGEFASSARGTGTSTGTSSGAGGAGGAGGGTGGAGGQLTCVSVECDDANPCNGAETCSDLGRCEPGTPAADGTSCGQGKSCKSGVCGDDTCGDLLVSAGEDCDDGNLVDGDGCDGCVFSCVSSDPAACTPADECAGQGSCDDATHTCTPGTPLPDGTACAGGGLCSGGACTEPPCGNGALDPGEKCDDGNTVEGDGCDNDCTLSCVDPAVDCPAPGVCQLAACDDDAMCTAQPDPAQDGGACGLNQVCDGGACVASNAVCGDGVTEGGEDCDFGVQNGPGTGCELGCKYSCAVSPDSCADAEACNGTESCAQVMVGGQIGQACSPGAPLADCSACSGGVCSGGACKPSQCGDGCVDAAAGEQCEPPGTPGCDAACHTAVVAACGNGVREGVEQCDDSNLLNLDGCDAVCRFEQDQRVGYLKLQFATDLYCTANQLGAAIPGATIQGQLQASLDAGVADGSISILFKMMGLDDLTGTSDPALLVGGMDGTPAAGAGYDGTSDLDWWYAADPTSIDANRNPLDLLPGSISAKVLDAGPGSMTLPLVLAGSPAALELSSAKMTGTIGATSVPLSSMGATPGHLASEHLDPALVSYVTWGQKSVNGAAKLCGDVSAASLAAAPIPPALVMGGVGACAQGYLGNNSLLDVIIGGCTIFGVQQMVPTQPDKADPGAPAAGAGAPYTLQANLQKVVSTCRDKNNQVVNLQACLTAAAYSSFFKLATGRVIVK